MTGTDAPLRGSAVGLAIHSSLEFATLRTGGGAPLHVGLRGRDEPEGETVAVWHARPGNPFHGRLLQDGERYAFWASDAGWYEVNPGEGEILVSPDAEPLRRELRLFGIPAAVASLARGEHSLHASAVEVDGQGIILGAPSMHGKTTLAAAFAAQGHRLLAEDTVSCILDPAVAVQPGPAVVRLRADVAGSLDVPGTLQAALPLEEGRRALVFEPQLRGSGEPVPLAAVILIGPVHPRPALVPVSPAEAVRDLFALSFRLPTDASRAACFGRVTDLVARVPVLSLRRPLTVASLPEVVALIVDRVSTAP